MEHQHTEGTASTATAPEAHNRGMNLGLKKHLTLANLVFWLTVLLIFLGAIYFRTTMLKFFGFYEPDGFYHYSVIRAAVDNGFVVPRYLSISGWPNHAPITEPAGLYWVTLFPYFFLRFFGVTYYTVERSVAVLFGLLDMLGAYLLSRYLSKDKLFGLLVIAFVALSGGNQARTSALIYRGDSFVTIFLILALVAFVEVFLKKTRREKITFAVLAAIALALTNFVWNGAPFATATYVFAAFLVITFAYIFEKNEMLEDVKYILLSLFIWWMIIWLFLLLNNVIYVMYPQTLTGLSFLYLFIPLIAAWLITRWLSQNKQAFYTYMNQWYKRTGIIVAFVVIAVVLAEIFASQFIYTVLVGNGFVTSTGTQSGNFATTIQELQPPTPSFLEASFGIMLYASPSALMILLYSYLQSYATFFFLLASIALLPYLFMQIYDSGKGIFSANAKIRFDIEVAMLAVFAFYITTIYLQINAIRFNSLISVPFAIMAAYTLYWLLLYAKKEHKSHNGMLAFMFITIFMLLAVFVVFTQQIGGAGAILLAIVAAACMALFLYQSRSTPILIAFMFAIAVLGISTYNQVSSIMTGQSGQAVTALGFAAALSAIMILFAFTKTKSNKVIVGIALIAYLLGFAYIEINNVFTNLPIFGVLFLPMAILIVAVFAIVALDVMKGVNLWYAVLLLLFFYMLCYYNTIYTAGLVQADSINPQFINTTMWIKANTPADSVFLTLWPDGSVIEGIGNRTSVTDSVGSQNYSKADPFAAWLFNNTPDGQFLTSNINGMPNYLLVRNSWLEETSGIYTEALGTNNALNEDNYSFVQFTSIMENENASETLVKYESSDVGGEIAAATMEIQNAGNGSKSIGAIFALLNAQTGQEIGTDPFYQVVLYNQSSGLSTVVNSSTNATSTYSLLTIYSPVPRPGAPINITAAYAVNIGLENSNMYKLLFLCSNASCPWDNNVASLQLVYQNLDSKIFKVNYNAT